MKKTDLKSLVGFAAVQQLNPFLELLQIPLNSSDIPDKAARAIELAVPLVNSGMGIREALQQAIQQVQSEQGIDFDHASEQQINSGLSARNQFMGELLKADLLSSGVDSMAAFYTLYPAVIHSDAVQQDPRVIKARQTAMDIVTGAQKKSDFFTQTLEIAKQSNLLTLSQPSTLMLSASLSTEQREEKSNQSSEDNQQPT